VRAQRIVTLLLTVSIGALSMLAAHCAGYHVTQAVAEPGTAAHGPHASHTAHATHQVGHGDLLPVASGAFVMTVLAALAAAILMRRSSRRPVVSLAGLALVQLAGFVAVEVTTAVTRGVPVSTMLAPDTILALALQAPVAIVVFLLCRRAVAAVARLIRQRAALPAPTRVAPNLAPSTAHRPPTLHWALAAGRRGPPAGQLAHI
jgi:hypothetical protein